MYADLPMRMLCDNIRYMKNVSINSCGVIEVIRQLESKNNLSSASFEETIHGAHPYLKMLQEEYGAVLETAAGWQLTYAPEWLAPVSCALPVEILDETSSTQQYIRQQRAPCAIFAEYQSGGMGRRGNPWLALPADAILLSVRLPRPPAIAGVSVALGVCLCMALSPQLRFKWPNDIVNLQGHKIAGILTEVVGDDLLVGVGVNWRMTATLAQRIAAGGRPPAALHREQTTVTSRNQCAQLVLQTIINTVAAYRDGFAPFRQAAIACHSIAVGEIVQFSPNRGEVFCGFDDDGALLTNQQTITMNPTDAGGEHVVGG